MLPCIEARKTRSLMVNFGRLQGTEISVSNGKRPRTIDESRVLVLIVRSSVIDRLNVTIMILLRLQYHLARKNRQSLSLHPVHMGLSL